MRLVPGICCALVLLSSALAQPSTRFQNAIQARIENGYATVLFADGTKSIVPLRSLSVADRTWLQELAAQSPLAHGNSQVVVETPAPAPPRKTLQQATRDGAIETVQLIPPNIIREQLGPTCAVYAIVHCLDIAGYHPDNAAIYQVVNLAGRRADPWTNPAYCRAVNSLAQRFAPAIAFHFPGGTPDTFAWVRQELRQGRPVLAAFSEEIWRALPPEFIATHPWDGGKEGHAIVINGFVWNAQTGRGSFHIVNSWRGLLEYDLPVESAQGLLRMYWSLSPRGAERPGGVTRERVRKVTLLEAGAKTNLYRVETDQGTHKVAAPSEAEARALIETPTRSR